MVVGTLRAISIKQKNHAYNEKCVVEFRSIRNDRLGKYINTQRQLNEKKTFFPQRMKYIDGEIGKIF